jgi:UDP-glucose 4-epimerase
MLRRTAEDAPDSIPGDLLDYSALESACEGVECVFHCAGYAHSFAVSDPETHWRINFEGTRNLLRAAGKAGVRRFVFLSSVKAMADPGEDCVDEDWPGEPATPYGRAKRAAEEAVLEAGGRYGMHVVNLRLAMVYGRGGRGNLERMVRGIRAGWFPRLPETGNRRSLVHVSDVVSAMRLVAQAPEAKGQTYIIADPRPYSGREIYDTISGVSRRLTLGWAAPEVLLRVGAWAGDVSGRLTSRPMPLNSEVVGRLLGSACYLPGRIERQLGWRAKVGLAAGVREMLGY